MPQQKDFDHHSNPARAAKGTFEPPAYSQIGWVLVCFKCELEVFMETIRNTEVFLSEPANKTAAPENMCRRQRHFPTRHFNASEQPILVTR
jgi:hypothetical protein